MIRPRNILILSTGSTCRSQIAHGWLNWFGRPLYNVQSAGISAGDTNPYAIAVMRECGIDITLQPAVTLTEQLFEDTDIIVTVCNTDNEQCPELPAYIASESWSLDLPDIDGIDEQEMIKRYRTLRDDIMARARNLVIRLNEEQYKLLTPFPHPEDLGGQSGASGGAKLS